MQIAYTVVASAIISAGQFYHAILLVLQLADQEKIKCTGFRKTSLHIFKNLPDQEKSWGKIVCILLDFMRTTCCLGICPVSTFNKNNFQWGTSVLGTICCYIVVVIGYIITGCLETWEDSPFWWVILPTFYFRRNTIAKATFAFSFGSSGKVQFPLNKYLLYLRLSIT